MDTLSKNEIAAIQATKKGDINSLKPLLDKKVDPNKPLIDKNTLLHIAVSCEHLFTVKLLLDHKANPNLQNKNGTTPLMTAVLRKNPDIIQLLIVYKADLHLSNYEGETALILTDKISLGKMGPERDWRQEQCRNLLLIADNVAKEKSSIEIQKILKEDKEKKFKTPHKKVSKFFKDMVNFNQSENYYRLEDEDFNSKQRKGTF